MVIINRNFSNLFTKGHCTSQRRQMFCHKSAKRKVLESFFVFLHLIVSPLYAASDRLRQPSCLLQSPHKIWRPLFTAHCLLLPHHLSMVARSFMTQLASPSSVNLIKKATCFKVVSWFLFWFRLFTPSSRAAGACWVWPGVGGLCRQASGRSVGSSLWPWEGRFCAEQCRNRTEKGLAC